MYLTSPLFYTEHFFSLLSIKINILKLCEALRLKCVQVFEDQSAGHAESVVSDVGGMGWVRAENQWQENMEGLVL